MSGLDNGRCQAKLLRLKAGIGRWEIQCTLLAGHEGKHRSEAWQEEWKAPEQVDKRWTRWLENQA